MDRAGRAGDGDGRLAVRRFRTENRRLDGMISDFDREHPRREPGFATHAATAGEYPSPPVVAVLEATQVTGYPEEQLRASFFARQHPQEESSINGCAKAQDVAREHP